MANARQRTGKDRNARIYKKIEENVESGKFYEASQMAKTLFFRYKLQKKFQDAVTLLFDSSILLLKHNQHESGIDLAREMIKCLQEAGDEVRSTSIDLLVAVLKQCRKDSPSRCDFIKESLLLTSSEFKHGHPKLHNAAAVRYWEEQNYQAARAHFMHTSEGSLYATFLIEYHVTAGYPGEIDLFVTQAVLHGSLQQFTSLCEQYQLSISRDPIYFEYLDKIGQLFFGLPPKEKEKPAGLMGVLGDLMQSIVGEPEIEESGMEVEPASEDID
eukprot:gene8958-9911_t